MSFPNVPLPRIPPISGIPESGIFVGNPELSMFREKIYFVYLLASKRNGTLYIGVTNNLARRIYEHKEKVVKGFTQRYNVSMLVYYEMHGNINEAIRRENGLRI